MIEHDAVCHAARRFADYVALHGEDHSLEDLFGSVGLDEATLTHMLVHCRALGLTLDARPFILGALFALLSLDRTVIELTPNDITELLRPLP
jgi:hypothetical protein